MQKVDINNLIKNDVLIKNIPINNLIIGKIDTIIIDHMYDYLNLFYVECDTIIYFDQKRESVKYHILPNSLKHLSFFNGSITTLPEILPNNLTHLQCCDNKLTYFTKDQLPHSLKKLFFDFNQITSFPDDQLPNFLKILSCNENKLTKLPNLPISLKELCCSGNNLTSLPEIKNKIKLWFYQDNYIENLSYNKNIKLKHINKINILGYPFNPIRNTIEMDRYMDYIKNKN